MIDSSIMFFGNIRSKSATGEESQTFSRDELRLALLESTTFHLKVRAILDLLKPGTAELYDHEKAQGALVLAASMGDHQAITSLLARKPHINVCNRCFGSALTAVTAAARRGKYETAKLLLDERANVNADSMDFAL